MPNRTLGVFANVILPLLVGLVTVGLFLLFMPQDATRLFYTNLGVTLWLEMVFWAYMGLLRMGTKGVSVPFLAFLGVGAFFYMFCAGIWMLGYSLWLSEVLGYNVYLALHIVMLVVWMVVGTLMATGRLVSDREFLAAETLGFSVRFLFLPVLATGLLISVVSFLVNDIFLPLGSIRFNRLRREIAASSPSVELESNSIKKNQNAVIVSGNISGNRMDEILILDADASGERRIIAAPGAVIADAADPAVLMTLRMDDASVFIFPEPRTGDYDWIQAASLSYHLLFRNLFGTNSGTVTPREMSSRDLYRELQVKEAAVPAAERETDRTLNMWRMEFHKKFSVPLGALFFSLLAFVLGLGAKTNGQAVGFVAGLLIAVLYWVLLVGGQTLCLRLSLDGMLTMWVPNAAVLLAALAVATVRIVK